MEQVIVRRKVFDPLKQRWVDEELPTYTIRLFGKVNNVTEPTLIASATIPTGSPPTDRMSWLVARSRFYAGSPETLFSIVHSELGTVDEVYFESPGDEVVTAGEFAPYTLPSGEVRVYLTTPGSAKRGFGVSMEGPVL